MGEELERAFAFMARGDMAGTGSRPTRYGTMVWHERSRRHDSNYLVVEALPPDVHPAEVAADAEEAHAAARVAHRVVVAKDAATGDRLAPWFESQGWRVERSVVMVVRHPPEKAVDTTRVVETDAAALRPARERHLAAYPWATPEVIETILGWKSLLPVPARFFGSVVDGEVVSAADLYLEGEDAQIEDVMTAAEHRNRGHASAVVARAVDEATRAGARFVFLVAHADDWPKDLYRRLGFEEVGRYLKFVRAASE